MKKRLNSNYAGLLMIMFFSVNAVAARQSPKTVMYSGTIQEIELAGMKDKLLVKTILELEIIKIQ